MGLDENLLCTDNKTTKPRPPTNLNILGRELAEIILPGGIGLMQSHPNGSADCKSAIVPTRVQDLFPDWKRPETYYQQSVDCIKRPDWFDQLSSQ